MITKTRTPEANNKNISETRSKFYLPLKWNEKYDKNELLEYMIKLKMNQNSIKDFSNLEYELKDLDLKLCLQTEAKINASEERHFEGKIYLNSQEIIEERVKIVDFLMKTCKKYNLKNETFFKSISILDNFLSKTNQKIKNSEELKLISVICLNLGCKLEEINCNFLIFFRENLLDKNLYEVKDLINKELDVLRTLEFKLDFSYFYLFNNIFMQIALSYILNEADLSLSFNNNNNSDGNLNLNENEKRRENCFKLFNDLIKHNDIITKKFLMLKESIFSSALNCGIVCFKMTLLSMKFSGNPYALIINQYIDKEFLSLSLNPEYLQRCDIVSSNIFKFFSNPIQKTKSENLERKEKLNSLNTNTNSNSNSNTNTNKEFYQFNYNKNSNNNVQVQE
jgi:hypothetical protein